MKPSPWLKQVLWVLPISLLFGCYDPKVQVSVTLPELPDQITKTSKLGGAKPPTNPKQIATTKTLPTLPSVVISTDQRGQQEALRKRLDQESNQAIQIITDRLKEFYQIEIDTFYETEMEKLGIKSTEVTERFRTQTRVIFERYSMLRAPVVTRLAFLADFPLPKQLIPLDEEGLTKSEVKQRTEIRELQRKLLALDADYDKEIAEIEEAMRDDLGAQADILSNGLDRKEDEISRRSLQEASRQVRRFSETITARLFPDTARKLPATSGGKLTFPKTQPNVPAPPVTFTDSSTVSNRALLENELAMWISLNRYELVDPAPGVKDATAEFMKWRKSLSNR